MTESQEYYQERTEEIIQHVVDLHNGTRIGNKNKIVIGDEVYKVVMKKKYFVFGVDVDLLGYELFLYKDSVYKLVELR